ncbi:hypothetical protein H5410_047267 [Solanum commersonii]|uniref:Uncharacterized protein n=1 Tax=Solanum commersonii TaxID=4109 RepID=A0A9J5XEL3_SOLCO|nr:hypothetical protein H5410_047267 [Solanum commersonii]
MSERLFEGDLPEGRGTESSIRATGTELVAIQSLASLRGDVQPTLLEQELRSPEQVPHSVLPVFDQTPRSFDVESDKEEEEEVPLKWSRKGVRGANTLTVGIPDLETVKKAYEAILTYEPAECAKKRKRKGKGNLVESHSKEDKKRKKRREGHLPEEPISTHLLVGTSKTKSDDITTYVAKRRKKVEVERVKSKES